MSQTMKYLVRKIDINEQNLRRAVHCTPCNGWRNAQITLRMAIIEMPESEQRRSAHIAIASMKPGDRPAMCVGGYIFEIYPA